MVSYQLKPKTATGGLKRNFYFKKGNFLAICGLEDIRAIHKKMASTYKQCTESKTVRKETPLECHFWGGIFCNIF